MENEQAPQETPQETPQEQSKDTFTKAELEAELARVRQAEKDDAEKRIKGLSRLITFKDSEIKALRSQPGGMKLDGLKKTASDLAAEIERTEDEGTKEARRQDLARVNSVIQGIESNRTLEDADRARELLHGRIKAAGLDINDRRFRQVRLAFTAGDFSLANEELDEVLAQVAGEEKQEEKVEQKEAPKARTEAEIEADLRKKLEAEYQQKYAPLTKQDTGTPSGAAKSRNELWAKAARGELSPEEAQKAGIF